MKNGLQGGGRWIVVLLGLFLLSFLPLEMSSAFHDSQRLISSWLFLLGIVATIRFARISRQALWLLTGIYLYGMVVVVASPIPMWSLLEFSLLFTVVLFALVFMPAVTGQDMRWLLLCFVFIQAFYLVRNLTNYVFVMVSEADFDAFALVDGFSNVRFYGQFLLWTVPFVLGVLAVDKALSYRWLIGLVVIFAWAFAFLTGTRAFFLGMLFSMIGVIWVVGRYGKSYLQYCVVTAALGFGVYYVMAMLIPDWFRQPAEVQALLSQSVGRDITTSYDRIALWQDAWRVAWEHPLLGGGPMVTAVEGVSQFAAHPHNYVLQLLAEWGIPFSLGLLLLGAWGVWRWRQQVRCQLEARWAMALPVTASVSAVAVAGLVDGFLVMPVSLVYMGLVLSVGVAQWRMWTVDTPREVPSYTLLLMALLPTVWLACFVMIDWLGIGGDSYALTGFQTVDLGFPRFWIDGNIRVP
ncbi:MAG: O-antigen ligase family protein [Candidatus Thiothrix moscowensis]|nr:O-antigen ligase family protein [Candidatus Thiothrix moscowensis]